MCGGRGGQWRTPLYTAAALQDTNNCPMEVAAAAPTADDDPEAEAPAVLFDSGTESYSDSPVAEDEAGCCMEDTFGLLTCQSYNAFDVAAASSTCNVRRRTITSMKEHIIDRSISVDENILEVPLTPTPCINSYSTLTLNGGSLTHYSTVNNKAPTMNSHSHSHSHGYSRGRDPSRERQPSCSAGSTQSLLSILKATSCYDASDLVNLSTKSDRKVQFPEEESILATYREPDDLLPFELTEIYYTKGILEEYERSCQVHRAEELDTIKSQLAEIKHNTNRSAVFNLANVRMTMEVCETIEDLFRITNFHSIALKDAQFSAESIREFVNILEYYNCVSELILSDIFVEPDNFKTFYTAVPNMLSLESVCFHSMNINDQQMRALLQHLLLNDNINTLKFDRCHFDVKLIFNSGDFITNHAIRELYLPHSGIYAREADYLSKYLVVSKQLRVLDISNNPLGDRGLDALTKSICASDISVLVIFNDQLTEKSGSTINNIISCCTRLHTLNVGFNNLTDQVIEAISPGLEQTATLEGLGMQQTLLTCRGLSTLAAVIQKNKSLQKINLKCNKGIQVEGLEKLCQALTNTKILRIEIDDNNRNCHDCTRYSELVQNLNCICSVNQSLAETDSELSTLLWRKVSLNCEPIYMPLVEPQPLSVANPVPRCPSTSPVTSHVIMPGAGARIGQTRFSVVKIAAQSLEEHNLPRNTKFKQSSLNNTSPTRTAGQAAGRFRVFSVSPVPRSGSGLASSSCSDSEGRRSPALLSCCDSSVSSSPSPSITDDDDTTSCQLQALTFQNVRSSVSSIDSVDSVQIGDVVQGGSIGTGTCTATATATGTGTDAPVSSSRDSLLFDSSAPPSCESD